MCEHNQQLFRRPRDVGLSHRAWWRAKTRADEENEENVARGITREKESLFVVKCRPSHKRPGNEI
jgi:hypothetical protein